MQDSGADGQIVVSRAIASKATRGSIYSIAASAVTLTSGFLRAVLLARLLLPEHFGVATLAMFYVALANQAGAFGLDQALMHRQDADEKVLSTYFTLRMGTVLGIAILIVLAAPPLGGLYPTMPLLRWVLVALAGIGVIQGLGYVQDTLLRKELAFRQLAVIDIVASLVMTIVAPALAWAGWGVWALVAEQASGILTRTILNWLLFLRWSPRLGWDRATARWFWGYGKPMWGASNLYFLTDRFDDFWIGTTLGKTLLGYYSRAYEFAHYPRRILANPLVSVFVPVFARLQGDRLRLSQAFYRTAYVILRSGFLVSGAFALLMPEFIHLVIGEQWMPMLLTFRLMLIYTLLDALLMLGAQLLFAIGHPHQVWHTMTMQALFFLPGVVFGAHLWGINGVALAADGMLVVGSVVLYKYLRQVVDFSLFRLIFWPVLALAVSWSGGLILEMVQQQTAIWSIAAAKLAVFTGLYLAMLFLTEQEDTKQGLRWVWATLRASGARG